MSLHISRTIYRMVGQGFPRSTGRLPSRLRRQPDGHPHGAVAARL